MQLVFDPSLQVSPARFAADWNADTRANAPAEVQTQRSDAKGLYDLGLVEIVVLLGTQMAMSVAGNALYDLIKDLLIKQGVSRKVQIIRETQADGSELLVVMSEESN
jgi:hypothetical protein